ncbi:MAG: class I SAM-dependent methyltransferase [Planctomycetaceae bacterium]
MRTFLGNYLQFFRQFRQRYETTGAIAPSSQSLARSMTRFLAARDRKIPVRVIEIGPGTGAVTNQIVKLLEPQDQLHLVELNEEFVRILEERFQSDPVWAKVRDQVQMHTLPVQEYPGEPGDFVISGLPLNNFSVSLVTQILDTYMKLLKPGAVLSYFEYMYIRSVRKRTARGEERERMIGIDELMAGLCSQYRIQRDSVWPNLPPAWVQHLRVPAASEPE